VSTYLDEVAAEIRSALEKHASPPPNADYLFVLYAVLLRAKGQEVSASDVHDAWAAWMQMSSPGHDAVKPFEELDPETQREDEPYVEAIRRVARSRDSAKVQPQYGIRRT
jgi:hypothetical protein